MNSQKEIAKKLKNAEGKRLLQKTNLEYSKEIIEELQKNPLSFPILLEQLELTETEFYNYISGEKNANITPYQEALQQTKNLSKVKKTPPH